MHNRILWSLFLLAFILDYFRSRTESQDSNQIKNNQKVKEIKTENKVKHDNEIDDKSDNELEDKMKAKMGNEELKVNYEYNNDENESFHKKRKNLNQKINLRIEFCQSWSHRGYFNQVKEHLEKNYSNIFVIPSDFPLSATRQFLYYLVTFIQISLVLSAFCIQYIKPYFVGIIPNNYIDWIEGNKMIIGMGGFLIGNMLNNNITNTGAFEIYINERLVWSAVNNDKRVPNIETIIHMIKRYGGKLLRY